LDSRLNVALKAKWLGSSKDLSEPFGKRSPGGHADKVVGAAGKECLRHKSKVTGCAKLFAEKAKGLDVAARRTNPLPA
jgi:hypothetical protein